MNIKTVLSNMSAGIAMFLSFSSLCFAEQLTIRVGIQDNDGSPMIIGSGTQLKDPPGIGIDIIQLAAKELNIKLEIIRKPNNRVHLGLEKGVYDASGFYSYKKEREKEGVFPKNDDGSLNKNARMSVVSYFMYAMKEKNVSWDGKKISGVTRVGANTGYSVVGDLKKLNIPVQEMKTIAQNLKMLSLNRIQAYAAQNVSMDPIIATYDEWKDIVKVGPPIKSKEYYFMFSHQFYNEHKEVAEKFWRKIEEVRAPILEKYKKLNVKPKLD
jgi:polar amino acid transport system substrate-binding protein